MGIDHGSFLHPPAATAGLRRLTYLVLGWSPAIVGGVGAEQDDRAEQAADPERRDRETEPAGVAVSISSI